MRILLVLDRNRDGSELRSAASATGAEITESYDLETAVEAAAEGDTDAVLVATGEIARFSRESGQISSYLRHRIMNPLATVLGYAQLLSMGLEKDPDARQEKLEAIAEHALRIRDLIAKDREESVDG
jgi:nitrogen-specific signal transduction histidine kinase